MSFLGKVFGGGKKGEKAPTPGEAIQKLRETEDMLTRKQDFLEKKIEGEIGLAKKNATTNKRAALQALKRKKRYEQQLTQLDGTLSTIEFQREALENANTNTEVLKIMGLAAKALKSAHSNMDVDQVHDLMDEVAEQQEIANEISDAISSPVGFNTNVDEEELERELEELEQEELSKKLLDVAGPTQEALPQIPNVPMAEPVSKKQPGARAKVPEEDADLKELNAWLAS